jgi:hypothetical protein
VQFPIGVVVRVPFSDSKSSGELDYVFTINGIDEVVFVDGGSAKAQRDFHQLMNSLRPTGVIG